MKQINVERDFVRQGNWILPTQGTLGKKAENLLANTPAIEAWGLRIPNPSLIIPYEHYAELEGPVFYVLDWINHFFRDVPVVGVSSNSPDEDFGERRPGLYTSAAIEHLDRRSALEGLASVYESYYTASAKARRQRLGLPEQGMCFLVRPFIPADYSGSFSHFGEICLLTYTNPSHGIEAMQRPSLGKTWVDTNGKVLTQSNTFEQEVIVPKLFNLVSRLPQILGKGWELEFLVAGKGQELSFYAMQTTPIKRQPRFEVKPTDKNIFEAREVLGFGEFSTSGILYVPVTYSLEELTRFDAQHQDYCLATVHPNLSTAFSNKRGNVSAHLNNCRVVLDIERFPIFGRHGFAPHIAQRFREEGAALAGEFTNSLKEILLDNEGHSDRLLHLDSERLLNDCIYSPTGLRVCADEFEREATVELTTDIKPFVPITEAIN